MGDASSCSKRFFTSILAIAWLGCKHAFVEIGPNSLMKVTF
jgi:hypothetical protein